MSNTETAEQVRKMGRERAVPSLSNPNWLVLRKRRQLFRKWLEPMHGRLAVLDVGGRIQPYRELLKNAEAQYTAIDLCRTPMVDIVGSAEALPFAGENFDLVLCTQMLEYAESPQQAISEICRVMKPGGWLLLSVPSLSVRDAEEDRWRFWPAGIRQLLSGFSQVEVVPENGSIAGFFRTLNVGLHTFARPVALRQLLCYTVVPLLNLVGLGLDRMVNSQNDVFAVNYSAIARK